MNFSTKKDELLRAVNIVSRLATTRATLPILQNIYLEAKKDQLILRSTDLEQTLETTISITGGEVGKITIPARLLLDYLQNNSDETIQVRAQDTTLYLTSSGHQAQLKGLPTEEYPSIPEVKFDQQLNLPASQIEEAITKTLFASAADDNRPILNGLLWRFQDKKLHLVGTDGYRLALFSLPITVDLQADYIIPRRILQELLRLLDGDSFELAVTTNQVKFQVGLTALTGRVLSGSYPAYEGIIPKKTGFSVTVNAANLAESLRVASLFSRDSAFSTKLVFEAEKLQVIATSPHIGETTNTVTYTTPIKETLTTSINAQYLLEVLSVVNGDIELGLIDNKSPITVKVPKQELYLYLLMPLRSE